MPDTPISQLPIIGSLQSNSYVPVDQNGLTGRATVQQFQSAQTLTQTFLTVNNESGTLANSRYFSTDSSGALSLTDGGAGSYLRVNLIGQALAFQNLSTNGLIVRTGSSAITTRTLVAPSGGMTITNADGVSGNPTFAFSGSLLSLENLSGPGLVCATATGLFTMRSLAGVSNQTAVTNPQGVAGNPTVGLADNPVLPGTSGVVVPTGTTGQRPGTPTNGVFRFNSSLGLWEGYDGTGWVEFQTGNVLSIESNGTLVGTRSVLNIIQGTGMSLTVADNPGQSRIDFTSALANTAVTAGSYGSTSAVGTFTVDAQGRLAAAANATITPASIGAEPAITAGTTAQYWRGDKTFQTLNQAAVAGLTTADSPTFTGLTISGSSATVNGSAIATAASTTTFTNKTFDTAGTGNVLKINGTQITAVTGTGSVVLATSPAIAGGSHTGITSLGIRSTGSGAFDLTIANTENLTVGRTLTLTLNDAARTINLGGNITTAGAFVTAGANSLTLTTTGATNVTLPTSGTLITGNQTITLSGDASGSGTTAITVTVVKVNGVAYSASPSTGTVANITSSNTATYTATPTLGTNASVTGTIGLANGGASGATTTVQPSAVTSATTITLPATTDTLVGKATTDTLTNKTFDTAGTGNVFKINGTQITANTGTGSNVLATSPTLVTPVLGVATATSINSLTITTSTGTFSLTNGKTFSVLKTLTLDGTDSTTMTFPSSSDTVVTLAATQTLTNKTLTSPTISASASSGICTNSGVVRGASTALTDGSTITYDMSLANNATVTLGGNRTLGNPSNIPSAGQSGSIWITQDGTGSRTLSYGSDWKFAGGTAPVLSTTANAVDRLDYSVRSSSIIDAVLSKNVS